MAILGSKATGWVMATSAILGVVLAGLITGRMLEQYDDSIGFAQESEKIATTLNLRPGMNVGDIRAGLGRWTVAMAQRVGPEGQVYATAGPNPAHELMATIAASGVDNISVITRTPADMPRLPIGCCDAILVRAVYHHFEDPHQLLSSLARNLRPHGTVLIIEFDEGTPEQLGGHGISSTAVRRDAISAGFEVVQETDDWSGNAYAMLLRRRDSQNPNN
jgi:SAM-dependent methyltransferase